MARDRTLVLILYVSSCLVVIASGNVSEEMSTKMASVTAANCHLKSEDELSLSTSSYQSQPVINSAKSLALSQAIAYSITNQMLNQSIDFQKQPDLFYYFLSATASLTSSDNSIVGSGVYFDRNTFYPDWYSILPFNHTLLLFAPYATRDNGAIKVKDDALRDYTSSVTAREWFEMWLPDSTGELDTVTKETFALRDVTSFFAVANRDVRVTSPYFDCGRTDKWIVTVAAPVVDYLPRYLPFTQLRRPRFVAVSTVDIDFSAINMDERNLRSAADAISAIYSAPHNCPGEPDAYQLPLTDVLKDALKLHTYPVVRLSHLFSSALQVSHTAGYYDYISSSKKLNPDEITAEVAAALFADADLILGSVAISTNFFGLEDYATVYFEKETSAPMVDPLELVPNYDLWTDDMFSSRGDFWAGKITTEEQNLDAWARSHPNATVLEQLESWSYRVPTYSTGIWDTPSYSCRTRQWYVKFTMPIVGSNTEYRGEVTFGIRIPRDVSLDI